MSAWLCRRCCQHQPLVLCRKWMVTFYELYFPIYFHPLSLLRIFILTKQIHIQDVPTKEGVLCCIVWEVQKALPPPVGAQGVRCAGVGAWVCVLHPEGYRWGDCAPWEWLVSLSVLAHSQQLSYQICFGSWGSSDGTQNQGMRRHISELGATSSVIDPSRAARRSWVLRERRKNSECTLLAS